jgi:nitrogen fixation NifU-like protein
MAEIKSLYNDAILEHARNPKNRGRLEPADFSFQDVSPICSDELRIDVRVNDDRIAEIAFSGQGCAVSQAAASILCEMATGMPLEEAKALREADLLAEIGCPVGPARLPCALLSLNVLRIGLGGG